MWRALLPRHEQLGTMLSATGFKPDVPHQTLEIVPAGAGDVRAPWATASGFSTIFRKGRTLSIHCEAGALSLRYLKAETAVRSVRLAARVLNLHTTNTDDGVTLEFSRPSL
jgi:hypothetical protein